MSSPAWLEPYPRVVLGHWPTPLEPLPRLSDELGGARLWVKRDDCTGLATGGNKTRKLEYLLGDAQAKGKTTIITFGAVQSNHCRQTAAACAKLGMDCHLILSRQVENDHPAYETGGNVLLDRLLNASLHIVAPDEIAECYQTLKERLSAEGHSVYTIPGGGSNAIGALGYSRCAAELATQCAALDIEPAGIVHASSSAGTQAGLLYGLAQLAWSVPVTGINVYHGDPASLTSAVAKILTDMAALTHGVAVDPEAIHVNHAYYGGAYGRATDETIAAIKMTAELEGLLFDPVYSGKALCAALDQINLGNYPAGVDIVLVHTGGQTALNVYDDHFA